MVIFGCSANFTVMITPEEGQETIDEIPVVKETYGRGAEYTEDGRDEWIGTTEHAEGNGTRERGRKAEHIT